VLSGAEPQPTAKREAETRERERSERRIGKVLESDGDRER
jgi:hypothetical protein